MQVLEFEVVFSFGCDVGSKSRIHNVIMEKLLIEAGTVIGDNIEQDRERFPFVTFRYCRSSKGYVCSQIRSDPITQDIGFTSK